MTAPERLSKDAFAPSVSPRLPGERTPPPPGTFLPPRRRGFLSCVFNWFRSARASRPEQSRPATSSAVRDGDAPPKEVRRIRPAPKPLTAADYAPKPVIPAAPEADIEAMRAKLRSLPRQRVEVIAAAIGSDPAALWCFAMGAAA